MLFRTSAIETQLRETRDIAVEARTETRSHQSNCIEHNRRVEDTLTEMRATGAARHVENQLAISSMRGWVVMLAISSLGVLVTGLAGALYAIFSHKLGLQ